MTRPERLERLRARIAEIELLPASPERDRLLSEFRSRAVDVDTGVTPRAVRAAEPAPDPVRVSRRPRSIAREPESVAEAPPPAPPADGVEPSGEPLSVAERLSLDDTAPPPAESPDDSAVPTWRLGLRG